MEYEKYIGRKIQSAMIADDKKAIKFIIDNETVVVKVDGDCCSGTWIESVELPAMGFPCEILSISDLDMPDLGSPDEYEVISYYGCKISTDKGDIVIDYRNESNGYYGGNLSWPGDYHYGGVYDQNISTENWVQITD